MKERAFRNMIDPAYSATRSVLLRYRTSGATALDEKILKAVSQREGEHIFFLTSYKGVALYILDETTYATTHTFEALIAAITVAHCKKRGHDTAIFSSGGNLGTALAAYCKKAGMRALSFNPLVNMPLLDGRWFKGNVHLIGVQDTQHTRDMMLLARKKLQKKLGYDPLIPTIPWRLEAARFRGLSLIEFMLKKKVYFSFVAQTISAGFGPLGTFEMLAKATHDALLPNIPSFLGVQQEANCYMYRRWKRASAPQSSNLIVPTLFDKNPHKTFGTYPAMASLLKRTKGDIVTINQKEFSRLISRTVLQRLREGGVVHTKKKGRFVAQSGLMALAGVMKAIDRGIIQKGPVLVCMTDGSQKISRPAIPEIVITNKKDIDRALDLIK